MCVIDIPVMRATEIVGNIEQIILFKLFSVIRIVIIIKTVFSKILMKIHVHVGKVI